MLVGVAFVVAVADFVLLMIVRSDQDHLEEKIERLGDQIADLGYDTRLKLPQEEQARRTESRLRSLESSLRTLNARSGTDRAEYGDASLGSLEDLIDQKLGARLSDEEETKGRRRRGITIDQLAEDLSMSENQKLRVADAIDRARERVAELGSMVLEQDPQAPRRLNELIRSKGKPMKKVRTIIRDLRTTNPPDMDESYWEVVKQLRQETRDEVRSVLTAEQFDELRKRKIALFNVKTGFFKNR